MKDYKYKTMYKIPNIKQVQKYKQLFIKFSDISE